MSEKKETIHHYSLIYSILRRYEIFAFKKFYKHIQTIGKENVPTNEAVIFAPNHQNALMDALSVLNTNNPPIIFFGRADIFKKKFIAKILTALKIKPIYRIRDGVSSLSKNEEIFQSAISILKDHKPICIMPEGNHGDKRRLRKLVKGIFRIALRTQEEFGQSEKVKIIPVGLDYSNYSKFFQNVLIVYGQAIEVSDYLEEYLKDSPKGINALRERLICEMKKNMIHIENEEFYDMYQYLRDIYNAKMRSKVGIVGKSHYDRFRADKQMIKILDEKYEQDPEYLRSLSDKTLSYKKGLEKLNLRNWVFERSGFTTKKLIYKRLGLYISAPLFLYGFLNNYFPYTLPVKSTKSIKDIQFHSSFKFGLAIFLFPIFYILQTVIVGLLTGPGWIMWAYLASIPIFGYFAFFWHIWHKRWKAGLKYRKMKKSRNTEILDLENLHKEIIDGMDKIIEKSLNK